MKVVLDKSFYGHCPGLDRSFNIADSLLVKAQTEGKKIFYDVPLTHNEEAMKKLEEQGMKKIDLADLADGNGNYFLVSAHGASNKKFEDLKARNFLVEDATCSIVGNLQKQVISDYQHGYKIIIFGKKGHPEIEGVNGSIDNSAVIVKSVDEAALIKVDGPTSIVCQTTFSSEDFEQLVRFIHSKFPGVEFVVRNTVCPIVRRRVKEIVDYAKSEPVDLVVVVGSATSSNTKLLADKVAKHKKTMMVDNSSDLLARDFVNTGCVMVVSGTSAPPEIVEEVAKKIAAF